VCPPVNFNGFCPTSAELWRLNNPEYGDSQVEKAAEHDDYDKSNQYIPGNQNVALDRAQAGALLSV
jgi:hypothetical protein